MGENDIMVGGVPPVKIFLMEGVADSYLTPFPHFLFCFVISSFGREELDFESRLRIFSSREDGFFKLNHDEERNYHESTLEKLVERISIVSRVLTP